MNKLTKAVASMSYTDSPYKAQAGIVPGTNVEIPAALLQSPTFYGDITSVPVTYQQEVKQSQFFYRFDPIASTVINRMVDMSIGKLLNRRINCTKEEISYYRGVSREVRSVISQFALEYLLSGMVIADYTIKRERGDKIDRSLGKTRYYVPDSIWVRNPENIILKRMPTGMKRAVYLRVPNDEASFIRNYVEGRIQDPDVYEQDLFNELKTSFPEYIEMIMQGKALIPLKHIRPILRKPITNSDWPQPFLVPALASLKHKWRIKEIDYSIATRALEAIQHIRAGNDEYPVEEDDESLKQIEDVLSKQNAYGTREIIYKLFTNHTVNIEWIYPPMDTLLSESKYAEPNSDILMAMGFSRTLLVGESLRSNSGQSTTTTLGPIATLNELRDHIIYWIEGLYEEVREMNNFKHTPEPYFPPINSADKLELVKYAVDVAKIGAISKDAVAYFFDRDYTTEREQMDLSDEKDSPKIVEEHLTKDDQIEQQKNKQVDDTGTDNDTTKETKGKTKEK